MKSSHKYVSIALLASAAVLGVHAELASWAQDTIAYTPLERALFRIMGLPDGVVTHSRPAWEARADLGQLILQTPRNSDLYSLRAREAERLQDYSAAEADWKQAADTSEDKLRALDDLAEFYNRRVQPDKELTTLLQLGALPERPDQRFIPLTRQPQWTAFTRAINVTDEALLPPVLHEQVYNAWIRRYSKQPEPYRAYLDWAVQHHNRRVAETVALRLKRAFPGDVQLSVTTDANLARVESGTSAALAAYSKHFSPLWPPALRAEYFQELTAAHQLRNFLADAQKAAAADPTSLDSALRLFFYYEQEQRKDVADQQLLTLLSARSAHNVVWTTPELKTIAELLQRVSDYDESAHLYYMLYELPSASTEDKELGLSSIVSMLLDVPEQPLDFENRDLSLYKNLAQMDRHPGFFNGILSLVLNTTAPEFQYQNASQTSVAYFHRASASLLIEKMRQQFPRAPQIPALEAKLFDAYATYGQEDAIIRSVPAWLNRNPNAPEFVATALLLSDAYMERQETRSELALYDRLLTQLANKSGHMPIGQATAMTTGEEINPIPRPRFPFGAPRPPIWRNGVEATVEPTLPNSSRSPDYSRVLDRYISRLVQLGRTMDGIALFRREIDRNPDDPGIYERFALFLEQNRLDGDLEQTYRDAFTHFKDMSWASKLGRYYLRREQDDAYQALAHQITDTFKGSELALFLSGVRPSSPVLFRQVNLYAHRRFPYNMVFVRNLLDVYQTRGTRDDAAYYELLRQNWFNDSDLKNRYFEHLSSTGKLRAELAALPPIERAVKDSNLAALEMRADGEAWLTDYEGAAPAFVRLASLTPGDTQTNDHAISIERSLASLTKGAFDEAIRLAKQGVNAQPENRAAITRVGEIYADREMYSQARTWWTRVAVVHSGASDGYLDSATVFWDYYQFGDALHVIAQSRQKLGNAALFGYEAGAIYENEGNYNQAVSSYIQAFLRENSAPAKARLLRLAARSKTSVLINDQVSRLTNGPFDNSAFELRLALLEQENRRTDIQAMLTSLLARATTANEIEAIRTAATRLGFDEVAAECLRRTVALSTDPIETIQARLELARFYESHDSAAAAETEFSALLKQEPNRLGVIRAAVDFFWRQQKSQAAVSTLEAAADRAQAPYQDQLRREAAEKATNSGQYQEARRLLDQLLAKDPFNSDLLAEEASTYARQNDNQGLVNFYAAELKAIQAASMPAQEKTNRAAALRRGYVLALTATGQFTEALEQYQLILNAYPEDASLVLEIASFADAHQLDSRVIAYYEKATSDSPRDYRWPLVLARIQAALRHYPDAIAAYDKAAYVRPDRADLLVAKVDLETRLLRFTDALKTYQKLYEISFHDTQYLADQAEVNARLGNQAEALRLLQAACIAPHPNEPGGYITAMQRLDEWHMYQQADALFRERLRQLLLPNGISTQPALSLEVQILTKLHKPAEALSLVAEIIQERLETPIFTSAIGQTARTYLEPQEKATLSERVRNSVGLPNGFVSSNFASAAGFTDLEASELFRSAQNGRFANYNWRTLDQLQSSRLLFEILGQQLEQIASTRRSFPDYPQIVSRAFAAYAAADDPASQLRLTDFAGSEFPRLFVERAGNDLNAQLAALTQQRANQVLEYLITNGPPERAVSAISAVGKTPVWVNSYSALTGLYYLSSAPWATHAFEYVLGPKTVGAQIASGTSNDFLRQANWFYYAARYGDYLGVRKLPPANDYLPAPLEESPVASDSYVQLADTYRDLKESARAAELYHSALQISPDRADIYDRLALLHLAEHRRTEAISDWRQAFEILTARVEKGPLPPAYWSTAQTVLAHVNRAHAVAELKPNADAMLRIYARRNGAYQFEPFLEGIFDHPPDRRATLAWVVDLSHISGLEGLVSDVLNSPHWIEPADKDPLYRAKIDRAQKALQLAAGKEVIDARRNELNSQLSNYARYLADQKRWSDAWSALEQIQPASDVPQDLLLTAAALTGHLDQLLSTFRTKPEAAPSGEQILAAVSSLDNSGHKAEALQLEEYEYGRELSASSPSASAWFGMARVRLEQKRNPEALSLIRSVTLAVGAPFENLSEAVRLLDNFGLKDDATRYALEWKTAEPWNQNAQLIYARLKGDPTLLDALRRDRSLSYDIRVEAARLMRSLDAPANSSDELSLLTHKSISAAEASQPFYIEARLDAAQDAADVQQRTQLYEEAIALDPGLREPRLLLAKAAFSANRDAIGFAAFNSYRGEYGPVQPAELEEPYYAEPYSPRVPLTTEEESASKDFAAVEQLAAEARVRRQQWSFAIALYNDLLRRVKDPAQRTALTKACDSARQAQRLMSANLSRRPVVSNDVTQHAIVKPKLKSLPADFVATEEPQTEEEH